MNRSGAAHEPARILRSVSYFSSLDEEPFSVVVQTAVRQSFAAGQVILIEGEPCPGLFVIESGCLKAAKIGIDGREQVLHVLVTGDAFNAVSVFTDAPNQATVTALEPSQVWMVRRELLLKLMDDHPEVARQFMKDMAGRVIQLVRMVEDLSLRTVEARLARMLLDQAQGEVIQRQKWATQSELAYRLGTVPDVANRALRKLAEARLIHVERHQIQILDREGLKTAAQVID